MKRVLECRLPCGDALRLARPQQGLPRANYWFLEYTPFLAHIPGSEGPLRIRADGLPGLVELFKEAYANTPKKFK